MELAVSMAVPPVTAVYNYSWPGVIHLRAQAAWHNQDEQLCCALTLDPRKHMRDCRHKSSPLLRVTEWRACTNFCVVDRSMKSSSPLLMRQLILPSSLPGSGTPK